MFKSNQKEKNQRKSVIDILQDPSDKKSCLIYNNNLLVSENGKKYELEEGLPNLIYPDITGSDKEFNEQYKQMAEVYDIFSKYLFEMVYENEEEQRARLIKELQVKKGDKVLEVSCGTGLNVQYLLDAVGQEGEVHALDLSKHMIFKAIEKFKDKENIFYYLGNGSNLPFKNNTFDALLHVGGINTFTDIEGALNEFMRVTKKNGRIIISDEGMQENLLQTKYGKLGLKINGLYKSKPPMDKIPENARDITLRYVLGGFFYVISFVKGDDYDFNWNLEVPLSGGQKLKDYLEQ